MILARCLKGMQYLHAVLFFAVLIPLFYAMAEWNDPAGTGVFYFKCLLIAVPIIVTERAAKRIRSVVVYLMCCAGLFVGMAGLVGGIDCFSGSGRQFEWYEICYCVGMLAETLFLILKRFADRVKAAKWEREEPLAAKKISFLDAPTLSLVWYFVVFYLLGICLNAKQLCDIAFVSAIVYTFTAVFYEYFCATGNYLEMNKRTQGIPKRRLYGVSFSMVLVFATLLLVGMLPAIILSGQRQYMDIRKWLDDVVLVPYEYENAIGFEPPVSGGPDWMELLNDVEPAPEPSKFINALLWGIGAVCVGVFLYGVFLMIRQVLRDFRNSYDENGDLVEELEDDALRQRETMLKRRGRGTQSEAERIRRRYRKTIRKHRKDRPAPYECPTEIEAYAGLKDDEQMQLLHQQYEEVRYGKFKNI